MTGCVRRELVIVFLVTVAFGVLLGAQLGTSAHSAQEAPADTLILRVNEGSALTFDRSPDGTSLIIDLLGQLWSMPVSGGVARPLARIAEEIADDREPAISPDGQRIATRSDRPEGRGIWLHSLSGDEHRQLTDSAQLLGDDVSAPAWSPDGARIAFVREGRIVLLDMATGQRTPLAANALGAARLDEPAWSPDGQRLLLSGPWLGGGARSLLEGPVGAPIQIVEMASGSARRITPEGVYARAPSWSPDGRQIAYFTADSARSYRIVVQPLGRNGRVVTSEPGIEPRRLRWSTDGQSLFFVAAGRLRRIAVSGGESHEVPFTAELRVPREDYVRPTASLPAPGQVTRARGFTGLALSPDGSRIAMLALGRLWVISREGIPSAVAEVGPAVAELTWAPDGREVAWIGGPSSGEDIWATDLETGASRRITEMPGAEGRIAWSPDGKWIAFVHWPSSADAAAPSGGDARAHVRLADARAAEPVTVSSARTIGTLQFSETAAFAYSLQWMPGGDAVLVYGMNGWPVASRPCVTATLLAFDGSRRTVNEFPCRPSHVVIGADGSLVAVEGGLITRHASTPGGWGAPVAITNEAALYPKLARDGTLLYVARDGLRLRQPDESEKSIGWPLEFRIPDARPLLVRNVRIVPLERDADTELTDVLITGGRIERISRAGTLSLPPNDSGQVIDAGGRWAIPGLIDTHTHLLGGGLAVPRAALFYGVTTLREMWHPLAESAAFRDDIAAGVVDGARVIVSGPPFYPSSARTSVTSDFLWIPVDSATAERGLSLLNAFGAGHVKMRYVQNWSAAAAFVRLAHRHGLSVSGHCAHGLAVIAAGIDGHEHLDGQCGDWEYGVHDDVVQLYRGAGMTVTPVIDLHDETARVARDTLRTHTPEVESFMTPELRDAARASSDAAGLLRMERRAARARAGTAAMHAAGVPIALGTDAAMYPGAAQRELAALVAAGLSPRNALLAATQNAAAVIGATGQLGRIAPGYIADLVLLDGDPLEDIGNTRHIASVIQGGRLIDRDRLREPRELSRKPAGS